MNFIFLFFSLLLVPLIFVSSNVYAIDFDLECPDNKVVIVRITNPDPICVYDVTAHNWVGMGIAEYVDLATENKNPDPIITDNSTDDVSKTPEIIIDDGENTLPEVLGVFADAISEFHYENIPDDLSRAQSYLVTFSDGDFEEPLTIQTFSKVQPGDGEQFIPSFHDLGFDTFFALSSTPSKDKIEFYDLVAKTINPGKSPELFDVAVDYLAGDKSIILTVNYSKCEVTDYLPYTQNYLLFYQFSETIGTEIRDSATIYCNGINLETYPQENEKIISSVYLPYIPNFDDSVKGYVVHFDGTDFDGLQTITTFSDFSPSVNFLETPYDVMTIPGNPLDSKPQFFLESLPSIDKMPLYNYYAMYVNPGQPPEPVDVSIDLITGDGTILQRWNYVDCSFEDHNTFLEDSFLKFPYAEKPGPEIRDKSEFTCAGTNIEIPGETPISTYPLRDSNSDLKEENVFPEIANENDRANSFRISAYDGEFEKVHSSIKIQKFESIRKDRGPLTPINHAKQFEHGFLIESLPEKDKTPFYEFISRYVNIGKAPEPFDVSLDMMTGSENVLYTLEYANCGAIDFMWYLQQGTWFYQFSEAEEGEIRERYIFYCEGFTLDLPQ